MYYVYIIRCIDNSLYTGIAKDIKKRLGEHFGNSNKKAKYTKSHPPKEIAAVWSCNDKGSALKVEYFLKTLTKKEKETIIEENFISDDKCFNLSDVSLIRLDINSILLS